MTPAEAESLEVNEPTVVVTAAPARGVDNVAFAILGALSFCHLLNDLIASIVPAIYPVFRDTFQLDYAQIGLITLTYQCTASIFQPLVGLYTDHRPKPYSLAAGMGFTLVGLMLLARASSFEALLVAAALVGLGSAVFHPEASRIARMASGGQHGLAQSLFQVGGNFGSSLGPLLAAFIIVPLGQGSIAWFTLAALLAIILLARIGAWYKQHRAATQKRVARHAPAVVAPLSSAKIALSLCVLLALIFSKFFYTAGLTNYYTFYLIDSFGLSIQSAQIYLFSFLASVAVGTVIGGPIGDRMGRKFVLWFSILGALPFTLVLPYANLFWTGVLAVVIGVVTASAFATILVYAQELIPGRIGLISGLFFGLAFGVAGIGAAALGWLADVTSIGYVYSVCSFLPLIGLLTFFLPDLESVHAQRKRAEA
ncbi:MAG TPA: MFS transporter [Stellaceae bacterium]|jgi:FSR family fosmidomycin resistance protein-like MFS transporter